MVTEIDWENEIAGILTELSDIQQELLDVLNLKRELMVASDLLGMRQMQPREEEVMRRLKACHQHRAELLTRASAQGLPSDSIRSLSESLPAAPASRSSPSPPLSALSPPSPVSVSSTEAPATL